MKAYFCKNAKTIEFEREITTVPRIGEYICRYSDADSDPTYYRVFLVTHTFEDRSDTSPRERESVYVFIKESKDPLYV